MTAEERAAQLFDRGALRTVKTAKFENITIFTVWGWPGPSRSYASGLGGGLRRRRFRVLLVVRGARRGAARAQIWRGSSWAMGGAVEGPGERYLATAN